ncbi:hypothetical protein PPERSA_04967 [Pseudocohnilembus persalinus]|uniref:Uncharacterized protein n=1 Tax=Pseudocohnilembus persalinus TaxID=266149 RepID=A0A0V0QVV3_PSEPJ|nr:hypothetical protein PPERSA_04967 [Pseudocohnilembus persalinus]|eukprot:KRX06354.1 hypothetical protein PPERSA_04967 [Pseudocohnilembus persalinus]
MYNQNNNNKNQEQYQVWSNQSDSDDDSHQKSSIKQENQNQSMQKTNIKHETQKQKSKKQKEIQNQYLQQLEEKYKKAHQKYKRMIDIFVDNNINVTFSKGNFGQYCNNYIKKKYEFPPMISQKQLFEQRERKKLVEGERVEKIAEQMLEDLKQNKKVQKDLLNITSKHDTKAQIKGKIYELKYGEINLKNHNEINQQLKEKLKYSRFAKQSEQTKNQLAKTYLLNQLPKNQEIIKDIYQSNTQKSNFQIQNSQVQNLFTSQNTLKNSRYEHNQLNKINQRNRNLKKPGFFITSQNSPLKENFDMIPNTHRNLISSQNQRIRSNLNSLKNSIDLYQRTHSSHHQEKNQLKFVAY